MTYWQYLIKVGRRKKEEEEDRKKIEKYFKSSCLRELKIKGLSTRLYRSYNRVIRVNVTIVSGYLSLF